MTLLGGFADQSFFSYHTNQSWMPRGSFSSRAKLHYVVLVSQSIESFGSHRSERVRRFLLIAFPPLQAAVSHGVGVGGGAPRGRIEGQGRDRERRSTGAQVRNMTIQLSILLSVSSWAVIGRGRGRQYAKCNGKILKASTNGCSGEKTTQKLHASKSEGCITRSGNESRQNMR